MPVFAGQPVLEKVALHGKILCRKGAKKKRKVLIFLLVCVLCRLGEVLEG